MTWTVPRAGDARKVRKFAWLPRLLPDGVTTMWLEFYTVTQVWSRYYAEWRNV